MFQYQHSISEIVVVCMNAESASKSNGSEKETKETRQPNKMHNSFSNQMSLLCRSFSGLMHDNVSVFVYLVYNTCEENKTKQKLGAHHSIWLALLLLFAFIHIHHVEIRYESA